MLLAAALLPSDGAAAPVTVGQARARAAAFFAQDAPTRTAPQLRLVWDGESASTRTASDPALYVFNRTDAPGFVIVAGDDAAAPVLGYSFENRFGDVDRMPDNVRYWLEGCRDMILAARAQGLPADAAWSAPSRAFTKLKELNTALWDQGAPYNNECPMLPDGKERAVTGCIQTAEAIVMKYHRWPRVVNRNLPGYQTSTLKMQVPGRTMGAFDYDLMPDRYVGTETAEQKAEIARLMADLGVLNRANYNYSKNGGTGAYSTDQYTGLTSVLGFKKSATLEYRAGYADAEWAEMLRKEIAANRPVLYSGSHPTDGGHAFVLDGSSDDLFFHFNWGWSGNGNGWFSVAAVGADHYFPNGQDAIIGLEKDEDGTSQYADKLMLGTGTSQSSGTRFVGLACSAGRIAANTPFTMEQFGFIFNVGAVTYGGKVALAVYTAQGEQKELVQIANGSKTVTELDLSSLQPGYGTAYSNLTCVVRGAIRPGDRIVGVFWNNATGSWERMRPYTEDTVAEILLMPEALSPETIAEATALSFDRAARKFVLQTIADLKCRVTSAGGEVKFDGTVGDGPLAIEAKGWAAGAYTLTLTAEDGRPCTLRIVL